MGHPTHLNFKPDRGSHPCQLAVCNRSAPCCNYVRCAGNGDECSQYTESMRMISFALALVSGVGATSPSLVLQGTSSSRPCLRATIQSTCTAAPRRQVDTAIRLISSHYFFAFALIRYLSLTIVYAPRFARWRYTIAPRGRVCWLHPIVILPIYY